MTVRAGGVTTEFALTFTALTMVGGDIEPDSSQADIDRAAAAATEVTPRLLTININSSATNGITLDSPNTEPSAALDVLATVVARITSMHAFATEERPDARD